jgi:hypothetical protein
MNGKFKNLVNKKNKSISNTSYPKDLFRGYLDLIFPIKEIPIWKAFFLGDKLPSVYRSHLRLISILKTKIGLPWKTSMDSIQLDLTSFCNLNCPNCERSMGQAPCKEYISLEQIKKFIKESKELKSKWKAISLIGGEPTLHPQFFEALNIIKQYKDINPSCFIIVWTNGYGNRVNKILSKLPPWVRVENSNKDPKIIPKFVSYNIAPIDLKKYKNANFAKGCHITQICSLCLTRYGYYACGPGAAVDRVFGFDIGIKKLSEVTDEKLKNQMKILCKYCGHFKATEIISSKNRISEEIMSTSWKKAYENYSRNKPNLSLY